MPMIDPDLRVARTPPPAWYTDPAVHDQLVRSALTRSWRLILPVAPPSATVVPFELAGQPLLWTQGDDGAERVVSNVCTHRSATMVDAPCSVRTIRCPYHGRRFRLDGAVAAAPGFDALPDDPLPAFPVARLGPWRFTALRDPPEFARWMAPLHRALPDYPWDELAAEPTQSRTFAIEVPWTVYVENYLEGFHIPYVHPELASALDLDAYQQEPSEFGTLQLGLARDGEPTVPGTGYAALYFWLWPTTMINVYPWGVSLNHVEPSGFGRCTVDFQPWVLDPTHRNHGAGGDLDRVERQDQDVIRRVWNGLRAPFAVRGRYSPTHESGVHRFHQLLEWSITRTD